MSRRTTTGGQAHDAKSTIKRPTNPRCWEREHQLKQPTKSNRFRSELYHGRLASTHPGRFRSFVRVHNVFRFCESEVITGEGRLNVLSSPRSKKLPGVIGAVLGDGGYEISSSSSTVAANNTGEDGIIGLPIGVMGRLRSTRGEGTFNDALRNNGIPGPR
jgi:hypothetical protein